jgi:hypothetical protein
MTRKTDENGQELPRAAAARIGEVVRGRRRRMGYRHPYFADARHVYGDVLHFDDYKSAQEIFDLLGELGARGVRTGSSSEGRSISCSVSIGRTLWA